MFHRHGDGVFMDLSLDLRDPDDWKAGPLRTFEYPLNITALATEPISGILAIGTAGGVVYLFGGPGVETRLALPEPVGVRFLQFAPSNFQLVCLDAVNMLNIWDLSNFGRPKLARSARFDPTNSLTLSPCHSHAFLALNSGEIRTYDLLCLLKSPYVIPNMWKSCEDKLSGNGLPFMPPREFLIALETTIHPRDLNRLFVAYGGGIALTDLTERITLRAYQLILPPGAPGGFGYGSRDLLTLRKPEVTAFAIHPAGHFFVVGHADGSIAFWAVDDEENPLLVRTLDDLDVNTVDAERLDEHIFHVKQGDAAPPPEREPIFKLSWSGFPNSQDPRGGETTLAILGGLNTGEAGGLTVIQLPAFNAPEPPASSTSPSPQQPLLHPVMRQAMRDSLDPLDSYFYFSKGPVQDFLLIPRKSPHFGGTYDPVAILLLTEGKGGTRIVEGFQYPPPEFSIAGPTSPAASNPEAKKDALGSLADDLADTLSDLQKSNDPQPLVLPPTLSNGSSGLSEGQLLKLDKETYETLLQGKIGDDLLLPLKGGQAWSDETRANDLKVAKYQPQRILITHYRDLTIQFSDVSAQLLIGLQPTPIQDDFPNTLPDLTVDLKPSLIDAAVVRRTSSTLVDHARIHSVHFANEALETTVVLESGEVMAYRLSGPRMISSYRDSPDEELLLLGHVPSTRGFSPHFMLAPGKGPSEACTVSDIGLVAVAYPNTLYIVSMRGPQVVFRQCYDKRSSRLMSRTDYDPVTSLLWTISEISKDPEQRVRLIAARASGQYQVYTLVQTDSSTQPWTCKGSLSAEGGPTHTLPRGAFVIDSKTGVSVNANRSRLAQAGSDYDFARQKKPPVLVLVGTKGARCFASINGERIGRVEWGSKAGAIQGVQIVDRLGSHALVVTTSRHDALVYSLPQLEYIATVKLPLVSSSSVTLDETGGFIAWTHHPSSGTIHQATYGTLFDIRRVYDEPDIDFLITKPVVPAAPQPVSAGPASMLQLGSWLPFNQSTSGAKIDELLGGPNRPIPQPERQQRNFFGGADIASGASGVAATAAATQTNIYNRISSALNERGQVLSDLEQRFNALEEGSKNMVAQAKRLATQQTAKSWFGL
ncbi:hypothetical protein DXG03_008422 [Asterophora parasitica]|uniref:Lethal giant larvae (Lgl)-like C-terminal domain-containing protein n=1 Tax=Asterophora parasitica TaxID=117018 RepID=A0A9P7KFN7_9AGAR|nr:hypothetical protein DXG03_008422 [Asterophora parasitica]